MKLLSLSIIIILTTFYSLGQEFNGTELGIDASFNSRTSPPAGNVGLGLKYGFKFGDNIILGPSVRYQRTWIDNGVGDRISRNVYGGGAFIHARFNNVAFIGVQAEFLNSPWTKNGQIMPNNSKWVGTCLIGAGLDYGFENGFRLNAGVYYDVLDIPNPSNPENENPNSPFQPYLARNKQGQPIPIVYRVSFFIPITE